jgi:hypothetical protein
MLIKYKADIWYPLFKMSKYMRHFTFLDRGSLKLKTSFKIKYLITKVFLNVS